MRAHCLLPASTWTPHDAAFLQADGAHLGKTAMMPPAGCVFLANTRRGQLETRGVADAAGLPGADKYGQDRAGGWWHALSPRQAALFAPPPPAPRALNAVPRVPASAFTVVQEIGSGAFGKVRIRTAPSLSVSTERLRSDGGSIGPGPPEPCQQHRGSQR